MLLRWALYLESLQITVPNKFWIKVNQKKKEKRNRPFDVLIKWEHSFCINVKCVYILDDTYLFTHIRLCKHDFSI